MYFFRLHSLRRIVVKRRSVLDLQKLARKCPRERCGELSMGNVLHPIPADARRLFYDKSHSAFRSEVREYFAVIRIL